MNGANKSLGILYVRNDLGEYKDVLDLKTKIKSFIGHCFEELNEPPKLLVTYDSSHYIRDILIEMNLLNEFYFVVDEFQSIFLDSFYKSAFSVSTSRAVPRESSCFSAKGCADVGVSENN